MAATTTEQRRAISAEGEFYCMHGHRSVPAMLCERTEAIDNGEERHPDIRQRFDATCITHCRHNHA